MQTAVVESSGAANPHVPVLKLWVVSLSPTFAGRDLTLCRLKSHMAEEGGSLDDAVFQNCIPPVRRHARPGSREGRIAACRPCLSTEAIGGTDPVSAPSPLGNSPS